MDSRLRRSITAVAAWCSLVAFVHPADTGHPSKPDVVTIRGCVQGFVLTTLDVSGTNVPGTHRYDLTGSRRIRKLLKEHSGHIEEVAGVVTHDKDSDGLTVREKPIDKGRIYIAGGTTTLDDRSPAHGRSMDVRSVEHVSSRCQ